MVRFCSLVFVLLLAVAALAVLRSGCTKPPADPPAMRSLRATCEQIIRRQQAKYRGKRPCEWDWRDREIFRIVVQNRRWLAERGY
jgi:hypothetical protein